MSISTSRPAEAPTRQSSFEPKTFNRGVMQAAIINFTSFLRQSGFAEWTSAEASAQAWLMRPVPYQPISGTMQG
jgi:hypothetical protein